MCLCLIIYVSVVGETREKGRSGSVIMGEDRLKVAVQVKRLALSPSSVTKESSTDFRGAMPEWLLSFLLTNL